MLLSIAIDGNQILTLKLLEEILLKGKIDEIKNIELNELEKNIKNRTTGEFSLKEVRKELGVYCENKKEKGCLLKSDNFLLNTAL